MQKQASLTLKKITVAVGICMVANFASYQVYAAVPACPPVITPVWEYAMNAAGKAIKGSLVAHYNALDLQWEANLKLLRGAIQILTKQVQVSAQKQADTIRVATQSQAEYQTELAVSRETFDAMLDYGYMGQGSDPCLDQYQVTAVNGAINNAEANVATSVNGSISAAPAKYHPNPGASQATQASDIKSKYCSTELQSSGYCSTASANPNIDVSATNFFTITPSGGAKDDAKNQMINYIYGRPDAQPPKNVATLPDTASYMNAKREQDAFRSLSALSFKTIQSWTAINNTGESVIGAIDKKVQRYSGGDGYEEWRKSIAVQRERGLLIEYAKMKAFELQMASLEYEQMERTEALVAGINALEARSLVNGTAQQANRIAGQAAAKKVN